MTNIAAAIGLAQIEQVALILEKKRNLAERYRKLLQNLPLSVHEELSGYHHSYWMVSVILDRSEDRDLLRQHLLSCGIETRPFFFPLQHLPMYCHLQKCPVAEDISARGLNLPSFPDLTDKELVFICDQIRYYYRTHSSCLDAADTPAVLPTFI